MSLIMGLRIEVDVDEFMTMVNRDPDRLKAVAERGKSYGAIHHRFYANTAGGEILVVDEWPDEESFKKFFSESPDIPEMFGEAGVTKEPVPVFWRELDTGDSF
jgi:hypothetical protein